MQAIPDSALATAGDAGVTASLSPVAPPSASAAAAKTLNIVAHQDDDLLFLSPDLLHNIQSGRTIRTIYVTAGDAGMDATYWEGRQNGDMAAYTYMGNWANSWTQSDAGISGFTIPIYTLTANPNISLVFMHLPDGNYDGSGFPSTGNVSLQGLWTGTDSSMTTVDGSSTYTKATLLSTLTKLMTSFKPTQINTQDFIGTFGDGDHSDHHAVAYFVQAAAQNYTTSHTLTGYLDYIIASYTPNVTGQDLLAKEFTFYAYTEYDPNATADYTGWLQAQYTVFSGPQEPLANAGSDQVVGFNFTVELDGTGSSDPNNASLTYQWTQTSGPTVSFSNSTASQPTFTAPNSAATLVFQLVVNNGSASSTPATVTVITDLYPTNVALNATATASSENADTEQTADKAIDGVVNGYPLDSTNEWATDGGGAGSWLMLTWDYDTPQTVDRIILYDRPNIDDQITGGNIQFSDGSSISIGTLNNNGTANSFTFAAKTITSLQLNITSVSASTQNIGLAEIQVFGTPANDFALSATATASSETTSTGQTADKAIDGVVDGYPGDYTKEWATDGGGAGSWLNLAWISPQTINQIILYDRPNLDDQITGGNIQFSDGSSISIGTLNNDGSPNSFSFSNRTITSLQLNITSVSASTQNIGLAEIQVFGPPETDLALSASATASSENTSTGQTADKAIDGIIDGYPGDYTKEWATVGGGAGSWLNLTWSSPQIVGCIVLYDRPNLDDQITGGNIQFSDGSSITIGELNNDGTATSFSFTAKTITSLQLNITSVSASTQNIGLAEIQVYAS